MTRPLEALIAEMKDKSMVTAEDFAALIEALEQVQQQNKELIDERTESTNEMARIIQREIKLRRAAEKRIAELEAERHSTVINVDISAADAEKVAAEIREHNAREIKPLPVLSASPLAVKLPERFYPDGDIEVPEVMNADEVIEAIRAAGLQVAGD
ncbi:hypothetical protein KC222_00155 [Cedecea davisae]|uniref:Uncharacterized protein n=1 Tax=Cedecea davisae TaxID=158484 RepID=A0ABS6DBH9_9ENTR|nr:hypothetical protein [Cedecea davisae]MBU4680425.1 hypothetical protein [Cedecea davisae]MBU4684917.1 hypothetical protein [Cedecea davisae]